MPRALAVTWELVRSDLHAPAKKATLNLFDRVLGLQLAQWKPREDMIPDAIMALVQKRQQARDDRRWEEADALRDQVSAAGYEIEDTPQGPRVKSRARV
jgi:cysteinyl-tRNA synthetase